jgi:hypothetical protein
MFMFLLDPNRQNLKHDPTPNPDRPRTDIHLRLTHMLLFAFAVAAFNLEILRGSSYDPIIQNGTYQSIDGRYFDSVQNAVFLPSTAFLDYYDVNGTLSYNPSCS